MFTVRWVVVADTFLVKTDDCVVVAVLVLMTVKLTLFGGDYEEFFDDETRVRKGFVGRRKKLLRESSFEIECMYSFRHLTVLQYSRFVPPSTNFLPITSP